MERNGVSADFQETHNWNLEGMVTPPPLRDNKRRLTGHHLARADQLPREFITCFYRQRMKHGKIVQGRHDLSIGKSTSIEGKVITQTSLILL